MSFTEIMTRIQNVDNRIVRVLVLLSILVPLVRPVPVPMPITDSTRALYQFIEELPPGSIVLMSTEMTAGWVPNLLGTAEAVFAHLLRRGVRVVHNSFVPDGPMFIEQMIEAVAVPAGAVYGVDYVHLGFLAGGEGAVAESLRDFHAAFRTDFHGTPVAQLPLMQDLRTARDLSMVFLTSTGGYAGGGWIRQLVDPYDIPLAVSVTAVMAPSHYPFLDARQIVALLTDTKSGAEYETLIHRPGMALSIMGAQTYAHLLVLLCIVVANVAYFSRKGRRESK